MYGVATNGIKSEPLIFVVENNVNGSLSPEICGMVMQSSSSKVDGVVDSTNTTILIAGK
jgi:hypothetical protein